MVLQMKAFMNGMSSLKTQKTSKNMIQLLSSLPKSWSLKITSPKWSLPSQTGPKFSEYFPNLNTSSNISKFIFSSTKEISWIQYEYFKFIQIN